MTSPIFQADSYKFSHYKQYPPGISSVSSYIEPRSGFESHGQDHIFIRHIVALTFLLRCNILTLLWVYH
jgi:hypothetical protein